MKWRATNIARPPWRTCENSLKINVKLYYFAGRSYGKKTENKNFSKAH